MKKARKSSPFYTLAGRRYAVRNWDRAKGPEDAFVATPLSEEQSDRIDHWKTEGKGDTTILGLLFPKVPPPSKKIEIDLEILNERQLVECIERKIGARLDNLDLLSRDDLHRILIALQEREVPFGL